MEKNNLIVVEHPIISNNLCKIRDKNTDCEGFNNALKRICTIVFNEAAKNLPLKNITLETPLMEAECERIDKNAKIIIAPILRAGLSLSEVVSSILPEAGVHHIGMYRDETTLKPVWYYDKTPIEFEEPDATYVYVLDPMLATGNSAHAAIKLFANKNIPKNNIRFVSIVSAPEGVAKIHSEYPDIKIFTAAFDKGLNEKGYILPGLGDAGDRMFNTI